MVKRKSTPWENEEVEALKTGVQKYGLGRWVKILEDEELKNHFNGRTNKDLSDKWGRLKKKQDNEVGPSKQTTETSGVTLNETESELGHHLGVQDLPSAKVQDSNLGEERIGEDKGNKEIDPTKQSTETCDGAQPIHVDYKHHILIQLADLRVLDLDSLCEGLKNIGNSNVQGFRSAVSDCLQELIEDGIIEEVRSFRMKQNMTSTVSDMLLHSSEDDEALHMASTST